MVGSEKSRLFSGSVVCNTLSGARVLGDGLRALADGVLGELTGQQQTDGGLVLATSDRRALVVMSETGGLGGDALEDVVHERIHDAHRFARDTGVGVHLLQHLVDVDAVALPPLSVALLVTTARCLRLADGLLGALRCCFGWHGFRRDIRKNDDADRPRSFYSWRRRTKGSLQSRDCAESTLFWRAACQRRLARHAALV